MQAIQFQANIMSIRAKVDRSLGITLNTPELSDEEKIAVMRLQNINVTATFVPLDEPQAPTIEVKTDIEHKTPSQRMRAVLFLLWKLDGQKEAFETYYASKMEQLLEILKRKLD
jgi:hypothetical protein